MKPLTAGRTGPAPVLAGELRARRPGDRGPDLSLLAAPAPGGAPLRLAAGRALQPSLGPPPLTIRCEVDLGREKITLHRGVVHREAFPGGFRELPLAVIPPISLHPRTDKEFIQVGLEARRLELIVIARNNRDQEVEGDLELAAPAGWQVAPTRAALSLTRPGRPGTCGSM